ncbi:TetR/AcrR family transcriptional regulator [Alicyclobacillus cycloheptanicus]|uniref:AcrR family transcriptional regulator n=1 Tax=Alicyclobacillus cycloheptanicus TaxID=1457 RepID=A0ABT9XI82_9BACL|nr:TetR/AcrR family transcriptional regulator [Alicyclobacillus cycloheptanicus]MDQ0190005.1 AcrR family transcriptional regulator [Alicyclobacillus cycloheptanicus]WDM00088.1 TetR/AcrR family transcriptional regulator [Alicyclobacillus cycloheptanicus]
MDTAKDTGGTQTRTERRDAAENRKRILDAALRLFDRHGVAEVSMNQIATEAGIGSGTLYRRYRNKSELCLDLIRDNVDVLFKDIETYLRAHQEDPPAQRMKGVIALFIRFREKKLQLLAGVEQTGSALGRSYKSQSPVYNQLHEIVVQLFNEMKAGEAAERNNVFKADLLLMALKNDSYLFQREVRGYSPESFLEQLCLTFFPG